MCRDDNALLHCYSPVGLNSFRLNQMICYYLEEDIVKNTLLFCFLVTLVFTTAIKAQSEQPDFGIKFSGFVKTDVMFDSRQTVAAREGHFLLYPANESKGQNDEDINAKANFNMLAIQTRLKGTITGPNAFGAKTGGAIEGAFFGHSNGDVNGFRLRHAFFTMKWEKNTLLIGQYWHPMFVTGCFPGTVSFNTGAPFQPFSRNPQVRLTHSTGGLNLIAAAISQRDFVSSGPAGGSSMYLRNSAIPNMHLQVQLKQEKALFGVGADWKMLTPRLVTPPGYKTTETVSGLSFLGYARFDLPAFTWKVEGTYGQNLTDQLMLGGYAAKAMDENTGEETYMPTNVYSIWTDISGGKTLGVGCFAAITQNLGADDDILSYWGRGYTIDMIYRVAPRIMWNSGKARFALECEYTAASYGVPDNQGKVGDAEFVGNLRLLLGAYYFF